MSSAEQSKALFEDLTKRIEYFGDEFDVTNVQVLGVLEIIKHNILYVEVREEREEDE